jgi:hypothetical protein
MRVGLVAANCPLFMAYHVCHGSGIFERGDRQYTAVNIDCKKQDRWVDLDWQTSSATNVM